MITLTIPRVAPSPNVRMHWKQRYELHKLWVQEVWVSLKQQHYAADPFERAQVSIERRSLRTLDTDNLYASAKPVLDALKTMHVIKDDSPERCELKVTQAKGVPQTTIRVQSL